MKSSKITIFKQVSRDEASLECSVEDCQLSGIVTHTSFHGEGFGIIIKTLTIILTIREVHREGLHHQNLHYHSHHQRGKHDHCNHHKQ